MLFSPSRPKRDIHSDEESGHVRDDVNLRNVGNEIPNLGGVNRKEIYGRKRGHHSINK